MTLTPDRVSASAVRAYIARVRPHSEFVEAMRELRGLLWRAAFIERQGELSVFAVRDGSILLKVDADGYVVDVEPAGATRPGTA